MLLIMLEYIDKYIDTFMFIMVIIPNSNLAGLAIKLHETRISRKLET